MLKLLKGEIHFYALRLYLPPQKPASPNFNSTRIESPHENQQRLMWLPLCRNIEIYLIYYYTNTKVSIYDRYFFS